MRERTVADSNSPLIRHVAAAAALDDVAGYLGVELPVSQGPPPGSQRWPDWYAGRLRELARRVEATDAVQGSPPPPR